MNAQMTREILSASVGAGPPMQREAAHIRRLEYALSVHRSRAQYTLILCIAGMLFGGLVGLYAMAMGAFVGWRSIVNGGDWAVVGGLGLLLVAVEVGYAAMCIAPAVWSGWRYRVEKRILDARIAARRTRMRLRAIADPRLDAAIALCQYLDEMGHSVLANEALVKLGGLYERTELLREAATIESEAERAASLLSAQTDAVVGHLGRLAFVAAQGEQVPMEQLNVATHDAAIRAQADVEVATAR